MECFCFFAKLPGRKFPKILAYDTVYVPLTVVSSDHRVIARSEATWQSPGMMIDLAVQIGEWYQEIATALWAAQ